MTSANRQHAPTTSDRFDTWAADDDGWEGIGYLGIRQLADPATRVAVDDRIGRIAQERGVTDAQLKTWATSTKGRDAGQLLLPTYDQESLERAVADADRFGLLPGVAPTKTKAKGKTEPPADTEDQA